MYLVCLFYFLCAFSICNFCMSLAYRYTWSVNVSPLTCNKMVESARRVLNRCLPDVYIYTDHRKRDQSGRLVACCMFRIAHYADKFFCFD